MDKIRWDDDPSLGGIGGSCRICAKEHPGKICPKIKTISFFDSGNVRSFSMRGGRDEDAQELD